MGAAMQTRRFLAAATVAAWTITAGATEAPVLSVTDTGGGVYVVAARFGVPEAPAVVHAVLTDYAEIPRFMPGVRTSRVLERTDGGVRLEQEAVSKYMMFSKKVHLVLDVQEAAALIRFRDVCGRSFAVYEGSWTITPQGAGSELVYALKAKPAFGVPGMVLRKLLDRDARDMIEGLRTEIAARSVR
jgi:ribosome-associated toxin RatA of RatAB toxin-antitoxin module